MEKALTIVVPVFNTVDYLTKCLDSLLIESKALLDVIVIIDGCNDGSYELACLYSEKYPDVFKVLYKENGGHGSCCNLGVELARGKYVRFLDSDDWLDSSVLNEIINVMNKIDADVILTKGVKEFIYENRTENYGYDVDYDNELKMIGEIDFSIGSHNPYFLTLAGCAFKKEIFRASKLHFSEKASFDDTIIYTFPFLTIKSVYFFNKPLYHYYIGRAEQSVLMLTPSKHLNLVIEHYKALRFYSVCSWDNFPSNVQKYLTFLLNLLVNSALVSAMQAPYLEGQKEFVKLNSLLQNIPISAKLFSKLYKISRILPFFMVRWIFKIKQYWMS